MPTNPGETPNTGLRSLMAPIIITALSTIEFSLRGQSGGFYEEGGAKEARVLVKEGSKCIRRWENERRSLLGNLDQTREISRQL